MKYKNTSADKVSLLMLVVLVLTALSSAFLKSASSSGEDLFLSLIIINFVVILLPSAFYCKSTGVQIYKISKLKFFKPRYIPFIIVVFITFIAGTAMIEYSGYYFFQYDVASKTAYLILAEVPNGIYAVVAVVIIPAILEEFLFRCVIYSSLLKYGTGTAVLVSSLFFAMFHFSLHNLLLYLFAGAMLSLVTVVTDSIIPALLLHILNNGIYILYQDKLKGYFSQTGNSVILIFILTVIFLIFFIILLTRLQILFERQAMEDELPEGTRKEVLMRLSKHSMGEEEKTMKFSDKCKEVYLSPAFIVTIAYFMIKSLKIF